MSSLFTEMERLSLNGLKNYENESDVVINKDEIISNVLTPVRHLYFFKLQISNALFKLRKTIGFFSGEGRSGKPA